MPARRPQQSYDHRLRQLVQDTGDVTFATRLGVPRSTAAGWLRRRQTAPITLDVLAMDERQLQAEVVRLRRQVERLLAVLRLIVALVRACGIDLTRQRVPDGRAKTILLRTIERVSVDGGRNPRESGGLRLDLVLTGVSNRWLWFPAKAV